jgi:hypothetical protein
MSEFADPLIKPSPAQIEELVKTCHKLAMDGVRGDFIKWPYCTYSRGNTTITLENGDWAKKRSKPFWKFFLKHQHVLETYCGVSILFEKIEV